MNLMSFIRTLFQDVNYLENKIQTGCKFSQCEINEILRSAKNENIKYFQHLSKINRLSAFDISFLLSSTNLDENKIDIIKRATQMYDEAEFKQIGQTFSDFIFRVGANIDMLNFENLDVFKELVNCTNEVYDFTQMLKNPIRQHRKRKREVAYVFERIL